MLRIEANRTLKPSEASNVYYRSFDEASFSFLRMTYESVRIFVSKEITVNFQLERRRQRSFRNLSFYLCPAYVLTEEKIVCQKCNHPRYDNSIHLVTAVFPSHFLRNCHRDLPGRGRNFFDRSKDKCDFVKHGRQNYEKYGNRAAENHQRTCTLINPFT